MPYACNNMQSVNPQALGSKEPVNGSQDSPKEITNAKTQRME